MAQVDKADKDKTGGDKAGSSKGQKAKQQRNAQATKARILAAATKEFASNGLIGAKTATIATNSGVTKAMLCYYFDNKTTLYRAVLQNIVEEINSAFQPIDQEKLSPTKALEAIIRAYIAFEARNRWHGMLWFQEAIQNQGQYGEQTGWQTGFHSIVIVLERGITEGEFRQLDPFLTTINILGVCSFYFDAYENLKYLSPTREMLGADMVQQQTEGALKFILAGISK